MGKKRRHSSYDEELSPRESAIKAHQYAVASLVFSIISGLFYLPTGAFTVFLVMEDMKQYFLKAAFIAGGLAVGGATSSIIAGALALYALNHFSNANDYLPEEDVSYSKKNS